MKNEDALFPTGIRTGEVEDSKDVMSPWKLVTRCRRCLKRPNPR